MKQPNDSKIEQAVQLIRGGNPLTDVLQFVGLTVAEHEELLRFEHNGHRTRWAHHIEPALAEANLRDMAVISQHAEGEDWRAAAYRIKRRDEETRRQTLYRLKAMTAEPDLLALPT